MAAGNRGLRAIGDWLNSYREELIELFNPPKRRIPSYSTIRRVLLTLDYQQYSVALARFFGIEPKARGNLSCRWALSYGAHTN
ncbi:transposase family protein [Moorena producens]|uniref:transposase family protein n=1 Tax=Moorena producens TaxID=1155739 RepID=UPI003C75EB4C